MLVVKKESGERGGEDEEDGRECGGERHVHARVTYTLAQRTR
jgi:hypothetical protein